MYKLTVPVTDVLKIHTVACDGWKTKISQDYLSRVDANQNITFTETEVDVMFKKAMKGQTKILTEIFGEKKIDYDKLKTGSKVMITKTGNFIYGMIDYNKPVYILFYKTPHHINFDLCLVKIGYYASYITFYQDGKFALFSNYEEIDYITKVIEY